MRRNEHYYSHRSPQNLLFVGARDDAPDGVWRRMVARSIVCAQTSFYHNATPSIIDAALSLCEALIIFISEFGSIKEYRFSTIHMMAKMGIGKSITDRDYESALDNMFRQVEKGEIYDTKKHKWVDNPARKARPDSPAVLVYNSFKELPNITQVAACRYVCSQIDCLNAEPGLDYFAAAIIAQYEDILPKGQVERRFS